VDWHLLGPFVLATLLLLITPGPVMAIVAHNTLRFGPSAGLWTAMGVGLGELCLLTLAFLGLVASGDLLPGLFRWLSLAGALYLGWLAVATFRARSRSAKDPAQSGSVVAGLTVACSNPTAFIFYAAFFPQFLDVERPIPGQLLQLGAVYLGAALAFDLIFVCILACVRCPRLARLGGMAELASPALYLAIAVMAVAGFLEASL
jgi:threonine/homoserine/homoserine lactone efflux protein